MTNKEIFVITADGNTKINGDLLVKDLDVFNTINALKNLLIIKGILTEEELNEYLSSIKVMDKLTE